MENLLIVWLQRVMPHNVKKNCPPLANEDKTKVIRDYSISTHVGSVEDTEIGEKV